MSRATDISGMPHAAHAQGDGAPSASARDPVCGMAVDPHTTPQRHTHQGRPYYFCSAGCRTQFPADPAEYLGARVHARAATAGEATPPVPAGTIYTCPMHPQIRQVGPGNCPICGMALEPEVATAETETNPELVDMTRRFWIGLALSVPLVALEMGPHIFGAHVLAVFGL